MPNDTHPVPAIVGPRTHSRLRDDPPVLRVELGARRYFAVEVASDTSLFNTAQAGGRSDDNFFASWRTGLLGPVENTTFVLPPAAWSRLRFNQRLFYRVLSTAAADSWSSVATSAPADIAGTVPAVLITDEVPPPMTRGRG